MDETCASVRREPFSLLMRIHVSKYVKTSRYICKVEVRDAVFKVIIAFTIPALSIVNRNTQPFNLTAYAIIQNTT
jgi:hypothetical protein